MTPLRYGVAAVGVTSMILLGGCAVPNVPTTVDVTGMPNAEIALRNSMAQVNSDMAALGAIQQLTIALASRANPIGTTALPAGPPAAGELQKPVAFVFEGSLNKGVKKLADSIGYTTNVFAPDDEKPLPIQIAMNAQVLDIFKRLGTLAGRRATIVVDPQSHNIRIIYHDQAEAPAHV